MFELPLAKSGPPAEKPRLAAITERLGGFRTPGNAAVPFGAIRSLISVAGPLIFDWGA
jgi:hypothetical protein